MSSILEDFKRAYAEDQAKLNDDLPTDGTPMSVKDTEAYKNALKKMREDIAKEDANPTEIPVEIDHSDQQQQMMERFEEKYPRVSENDLTIATQKVTPMIKHAFCPNCHREIINKTPTMFNPFTMDKINRYDCECGWTANLEYAYPRVVFMTEDNNEIEAYAK